MKYEHLFSIVCKETGNILKENIQPKDLQLELDAAIDKLKSSGVTFSQAIISVRLNLVHTEQSN